MSQSSNDTFPAAMHIAAASETARRLLPPSKLSATPRRQSQGVRRHRKNRPHPFAGCHALTLGQEFSGYVNLLDRDGAASPSPSTPLRSRHRGTAVAPASTRIPSSPIVPPQNRRAHRPSLPSHPTNSPLSAHDELVFASGALKTLAPRS